MTDALGELAELTGMRENSGNPVDWAAFARTSSVIPPEDYRELVDRYGSGMFGLYLQVFGPDDAMHTLKDGGLFGDFKTEWEAEPEFTAARPGVRDAEVVWWGATEDAHTLVWLAEPGRPAEEWLIGLQGHDGPECEFYEMSTAEFLLAFVKDELDSDLLSSFDRIEDAAYLQWSLIRSMSP
ncbi:hypothetical protein LX16_4940 [Stackebrandtia albiflava]|uniref:SUKH superfamily protein n=1 Tax=Stackebrandtia albiflava TaxID=406432 RepID=A0A562UQA4_9ACTN|nr:hypothetical protein [Stackebrandtia albiflava]TWJ07777.1 hypothetical protein LX16_4940 [Stackebrandtia albiflava]